MKFGLGVLSKTTALTAFLAAAGLLAVATAADAGVMAVSIFEVNNFRATDSLGNELVLGTQIGSITGHNTGDTSATLNGVNSSGSTSAAFSDPGFGAIDLPQRCVGACPPFPENSYAGVGFTPPPTTTYALSDMVLTGTSIDISPLFPNSGGVDAHTRADVSIVSGSNNGSSVTNTGTDANFQFVATSSLTAEFTLDYVVQLRAFLDAAGGGSGSSQASVSWNLNLIDLSVPGGAEVLNYAPSALNTSRTATISPADLFVDTAGTLTSPTFTLIAGDTYQLSVRHNSLADAEFIVATPEPFTVGIFGAGLVAFGFMRRKTR